MKKSITIGILLGSAAIAARLFEERRRQAAARQWQTESPKAALITGASSGIGAAYARALAKEGYDLVLLARREDRLKRLRDEIQQEAPVRIETIGADLNNPADVERTAGYIEQMPNLDLLVNNAGFGAGGPYAEIDPELALSMVRVHVLASMRLARAALPGMIRRGKGAVINVSSMAGFIPFGGTVVYGATKAYLNFFSEALQVELQGTGVRVQALCPGMTYTELHDQEGRPNLPSFMWMEPETVVEESIKGLRENRLYVIPGRLYQVMGQVVTNSFLAPLIRRVRDEAVRRQLLRPG